MDRWWVRWLMLTISGLIVGHIVITAPASAPSPARGTPATVAAAGQTHPCALGDAAPGEDESCIAAPAVHGAATVPGGTGCAAVAHAAWATVPANCHTSAGPPRPTRRPVSLAELQVWRR